MECGAQRPGRMSSRSQTLLTESQLIEDSRTYIIGFPACHDAAAVARSVCDRSSTAEIHKECNQKFLVIKLCAVLGCSYFTDDLLSATFKALVLHIP